MNKYLLLLWFWPALAWGQCTQSTQPAQVSTYSEAGLPAAGTEGRLAYTDNAANKILMFDDGTRWAVITGKLVVSTIVVDATIDPTTNVFLCDATLGNINIDIPTATPGRSYTVKKIDPTSYTCTLNPYSTQKIDGQLTIPLTKQYDSVTITSDGSNWFIL
jgi:hypothetical protein